MKIPFNAYEGEENYIFVSYSHKDKAIVYEAIDALFHKGVRLWYDEGITHGSDWATTIGAHIDMAHAVILFLSKNSIRSDNVKREINYAVKNNLKIYTIILDNVKISPSFERKLGVHQFLDYKSCITTELFFGKVESYFKSLDVIGNPYGIFENKNIVVKNNSNAKVVILLILALIIISTIAYNLIVEFVPYVIGLKTEDGKNEVTNSGFDCSVAYDYSEDEEYGYIFSQNKDNRAIKYMPILLTESLGSSRNLSVVPDTVGFNVSDGISLLVDAGFIKFTITPVLNEVYEEAFITGQSIASGMKISTENVINLDVSSNKDIVFAYLNKEYTVPINTKVQLTISEEGIIIDPVCIYGVAIDYTETNTLNDKGNIFSDMTFKLDLTRENAEIYGKYRGNMELSCDIYGKDAGFGFGLLSKAFGDEYGHITVDAIANPYSMTLEPFDNEKYEKFVYDSTGEYGNTFNYENPICMYLSDDLQLTNKGLMLDLIGFITKNSNLFNISLPTIDKGKLLQPYSVVITQNGEAYVFFYGNTGDRRTLGYKGMVSISDLTL